MQDFKEIIKEMLNNHIEIVIPYKVDILSRFEEIKFVKVDGGYMIAGVNVYVFEENYDKIYDIFLSYYNNIGIICLEIFEKYPDLEPEYCSEDLEKLEQLVKERMEELKVKDKGKI